MPKEISDETKQLIKDLYAKNLSTAEIAKGAEVSCQTAYGYTKLRERINPETGMFFESLRQYNEYTARQRINPKTGKLFKSRNEYDKYITRQRTNPETGEPFESINQYLEHKARQRTNPETGEPFESRSQYEEYAARQRINPKTGKLFESQSQYIVYKTRQRQKRPEYQRLSDLIKKRLKELGKNQSWLAREMDIAEPTVSSYVQCRNFPREDLRERLYFSLEVPYKTLDDLLD